MAAKRAAKSKTKRATKTRKAAKRTAGKRTSRRGTAKRTGAKRKASKRGGAKASSSPMPSRKVRPGFVSHTELASADPEATKRWTERVLGWKFGDPMPTPAGPYHMWAFNDDMGGGIRSNNPPETPGSIPYCEVPDIKRAFSKALDAGAKEMMPPSDIGGGFGWIAIVQAPGGVAIGFWAPK